MVVGIVHAAWQMDTQIPLARPLSNFSDDAFGDMIASSWYDTLNIPAYISCASAAILLFEILRCKFIQCLRGEHSVLGKPPVEPCSAKHIDRHGGPTIFAFKCARLLACIILFCLSVLPLLSLADDTVEADATLWRDFGLCVTYTYASLLALISVIAKPTRSVSRHLAIVLLFTWGVYMYRDVWPLATFTLTPIDSAEGSLLWGKISLLTLAAVLVPICMPNRHIPIDPSDPIVAHPEQTASILSLMLYGWLDKTVLEANRVSHLGLEGLPPLADYDHTKNLVKSCYPCLDPFQITKRRHLFWGLMRIFRTQYIVLCLMLMSRTVAYLASPVGVNRLLNYLEKGGEGQVVRPWVWIAFLFFGPVLGSIAFQWYCYTSTTTITRAKAVITQLVFDHALRIRVKAEVEENGSNSASEAVVSESASMVIPATFQETAETTSEDTIIQESASTTDNSSLGKQRAPETNLVNDSKQKSGPADVKQGANLLGKINNLVTSDMANISLGRDFPFWWRFLFRSRFALGFCIRFWDGVCSALVGMMVMAAMVPLPGWIASLLQNLQVKKMEKTDARVQSVTEILNVIRMIKMFGWEGRMQDRLAHRRDEELTYMRKYKLLDFLIGYINHLIPVITMIVTYTLFTVVMKGELTASIVFSSITNIAIGNAFGLWDDAIHYSRQVSPFPLSMSYLTVGAAKVSLDRVNEFLHETELLDQFSSGTSDSVFSSEFPGNDNDVIGIRDAAFTWTSSNDGTLTPGPNQRNFTLRIEGEVTFKRGYTNLIVGPTGSGKTSMLMALLGEMHYIPAGPDSFVNLPRSGGIAYAAQESWVQNETIRDNILFGASYDEERYSKVIEQCGLRRDLELLEAGDKTEVGEKGLTLSGGQKARITLARAVYSSAEIVLLDDVLAALDVHTAKWIVEKCFCGDLIRGRTIILVTHNVALASSVAEFVVSMGTDGRIHSQGSLSKALEDDKLLSTEFAEQRKEELKVDIDAEQPAQEKPSAGKLIVAEEIAEGHVGWSTWKMFITALGGQHSLIFWTVCVGTFIGSEVLATLQIWFLGLWSREYETHPASEVPVSYFLSGYTVIQVVTILCFTTSYGSYIFATLRASRKIHTTLVTSILGTTLRWLDKTPASRIITRCTQDIQAVDGEINQYFYWFMMHSGTIIVKLGSVVVMAPIAFVSGGLVAVMGGLCGQVYIRAQLAVKREVSVAEAPVLGHFNAAIAGLTSLRAYGVQESFRLQSFSRIDRYTRTTRILHALNQWIAIRIDTLGALFTTSLASYLVYGRTFNASNTGFSLNVAVAFSSNIIWWVRLLNELEVSGNSLERIQQYQEIEQEPKPSTNHAPPAYWPASGTLRVEKLSARYSEDGPCVLHDISFEIKSGERVGIVGRTGSGKSSLTLALLRCILTEGAVFYDGIRTDTINLDGLRSKITIIPQVPELLSGTLRQNLDPFQQHDDAVLNDALRAAGLFSLQSETDESRITLDSQLASAGNNLSVGQRQILALARAIVRQSKLLILDEATSAIDYETDTIIQASLRRELGKDVTLLTIAHRLQTIMDADKIMVLDAGRIIEFGRPIDLLNKEGGILRTMVQQWLRSVGALFGSISYSLYRFAFK
ncbi:uncharacterized protein FIBRA_02614 [Fibroporia radiculosa]|uniref:P-loop containing nucleoside triphosphate hydrolase protein n=1 Tax=Fibroporia radiculosa TaxID=599839 RepID=J4H1Y4_9APHY|nr:uncharacterized protein FIBRA_02614 [Fibroporia radiculosa]CCM00579.1 predicted protein [Fibroporia radiculosa]